jgi:hypothetical protein
MRERERSGLEQCRPTQSVRLWGRGGWEASPTRTVTLTARANTAARGARSAREGSALLHAKRTKPQAVPAVFSLGVRRVGVWGRFRAFPQETNETPRRPEVAAARALTLVALFAFSACGKRTRSQVPSDAGQPGSGSVVDAPAVTIAPTQCGDAVCPEPVLDPLGERACCLASGACGLRSPAFGNRCLSTHEPGGVDLTCPERRGPNEDELPGCCTPEGQCGAFDRSGDLGCIPPSTGGTGADAGPAPCRYSPANDCTSVAELPCDGPEDCGEGAVCCAHAVRGTYDRFGCFPSCEALPGAGGLWFELCHAGDRCQNPAYTCAPRSDLPPFLGLCFVAPPGVLPDAGSQPGGPGVRCGAGSCARDEKCCLTTPHEPHCEKSTNRCTCTPETGTDSGAREGGAGLAR